MANVIIEKVKNCVVMIHAETEYEELPLMSGEFVEQNGIIFSKGTGFICSPEGLVITAYHVVKETKGKIFVTRFDKTRQIRYEAKMLKYDISSDTAILSIDDKNLDFLELGDYSTKDEGEEIGFIGFPLNFLIPLIHKGTIAAKVKTPFQPNSLSMNMFIINSFVNPGNSGGPVFCLSSGKVIGLINSRLLVSSQKEQEFMKIPEGYQSVLKIGNVDPILLAVESYNKNLAYIGEVAQVGIGISVSVEYAKKLIEGITRG